MTSREWLKKEQKKQDIRFWMKEQMDMSLTEGARQCANAMVHGLMTVDADQYFDFEEE